MSKFIKVVVAAAAGFVAGILVAPKSGRETREELRTKALEKKADVEHFARKSTEGAKREASKVRDEVKDFAKSAADSGRVIRDEASRLGSEAKLRGERVAHDVKGTATDLRDDAKRTVKK